MTTAATPADIGVIGGSGFYSFLEHTERVKVTTPFGDPTDDIVIGEVAGRRVAFLARHGQGHTYPPHRLNYRANLWALRSVGVRQVLAPCAVGSLIREQGPSTVVVPDQVVDRTYGREQTIYDALGTVVHVSLADPYCPRGRAAVLASDAPGLDLIDGGTMVVINGPRFSTRAESLWHRRAGWSVVGMTGMPEAAIARELAMCFTTVCLVTDLDAGVDSDEAVSHQAVLKVFERNIEALKSLLKDTVAKLPDPVPDADATCSCRRSLDGLSLPFELP